MMDHALRVHVCAIVAGFGLASHLGVLADIPCVGVGKKLFHVDGLTKGPEHKRKVIKLEHYQTRLLHAHGSSTSHSRHAFTSTHTHTRIYMYVYACNVIILCSSLPPDSECSAEERRSLPPERSLWEDMGSREYIIWCSNCRTYYNIIDRTD